MRKPDSCLCKIKVQISCAVTAQLISAFVFPTRIVQFLFFLNLKFQAIFYSCTDRFVPDLVGTPKDRFSHVAAHMCVLYCRYLNSKLEAKDNLPEFLFLTECACVIFLLINEPLHDFCLCENKGADK